MTDNQQQLELNAENRLNILFHIKSLGCTNDQISAATYRVYFDLTEVRKYEDVSYHFSSELNHLYLKVKRKLDDPLEFFVPITSAKPFSFKEIEQFQKVLDSNVITIAICDTSSIIQYYKMERS